MKPCLSISTPSIKSCLTFFSLPSLPSASLRLPRNFLDVISSYLKQITKVHRCCTDGMGKGGVYRRATSSAGMVPSSSSLLFVPVTSTCDNFCNQTPIKVFTQGKRPLTSISLLNLLNENLPMTSRPSHSIKPYSLTLVIPLL